MTLKTRLAKMENRARRRQERRPLSDLERATRLAWILGHGDESARERLGAFVAPARERGAAGGD